MTPSTHHRSEILKLRANAIEKSTRYREHYVLALVDGSSDVLLYRQMVESMEQYIRMYTRLLEKNDEQTATT